MRIRPLLGVHSLKATVRGFQPPATPACCGPICRILACKQYSSAPRMNEKKSNSIKIDRRDLLKPPPEEDDMNNLAGDLRMLIETTGPLSVADYMNHALQHPLYGYYTSQDSQIGKDGDFITAPEISQLFGEMIGVWCYAVWEHMGKPENINLVEMGPGKGTLMADILRTVATFPDFSNNLSIHMVESSPRLRDMQKKRLKATSIGETESPASKDLSNFESEESKARFEKFAAQLKGEKMKLPDGRPISWHTSFGMVPQGPMIFIGQEILDAFPIHQFQYTENGWRERLVTIDEMSSSQFKFILSDRETPAVRSLLRDPSLQKPGNPTTPTLVSEEGNEIEPTPIPSLGAVPGDGIEVCPLANSLVQEIATRIAQSKGAALFFDYGRNHALQDSLRAFHRHREVHVLTRPGEVDLTADVDFAALIRSVERVRGACAFGPIEQSHFLAHMGIAERLTTLLSQDNTTDEQAEALYSAFEKLVDPDEMGSRFKALALVGSSQPVPPGGFHPEE